MTEPHRPSPAEQRAMGEDIAAGDAPTATIPSVRVGDTRTLPAVDAAETTELTAAPGAPPRPEPRSLPEVATRISTQPGPDLAGTTTLPRPSPGGPERRRVTTTLRATDYWAMLGAAAAALATAGLLYTQLTPFTGLLGFAVLSYLLFLGVYALLVSLDESGPAVPDRVAAALAATIAYVLLAGLALVIVFTLVRGYEPLLFPNFLTQDMSLAGPLQGLEVGGILHGIAGTLIEIAIALAITVPLGILCAVFLNELPGAFSRFVRTIVEAMTALPSIVAGLFIYATAIMLLGLDLSGFAASLAITVMMLPIVIRAADVVIRLVPGTLREASLALGASQWRTVWHVTLPTARSGLTTAVILGTARGIGETSPVLITAGFTTNLNLNPLEGPMVSLPLLAFRLIASPEPAMIARGFGAAFTLMVLVLVLFVLARIIGGRGPGRLSRRQEHRRVRRSRRDAARMARRAAQRANAYALPSDAPAAEPPR
ncbi:phosphate ABC transporter permease PstA [Allonocardiopsis opalescens]|uniref:Phosphate transport system permease protein PstA n=1 Tax=Allonocardiopsis opalescens TaxID=1144618 RepID=A0A2T0PSE6_9ACTN|nr:phosphate ABC transporter permease PstA [Allonocardiopsis opalescens]PRX91738.1 phosphate ABC transporter membrane protein 2 (PhoT family) [Allonocardiopsis opalescens]